MDEWKAAVHAALQSQDPLRCRSFLQLASEVGAQRARMSLKKRVIAALYSSSARTSEGFCGRVKPCVVPLYRLTSKATLAARNCEIRELTSSIGATGSSAPCRMRTRPLMFLAASGVNLLNQPCTDTKPGRGGPVSLR